MGKYFRKNQLNSQKMDKHIFNVEINIHGKRHIEKYSIDASELEMAKLFGLFQEKNGYIKYFDWKPLIKKEELGGIRKINSINYDKKYMYAVTDENVYSLPKYLENQLPNKEFLLFGKREY